ncbi:lipase [Chloropicon primus]|uniref:Lipase n=1 Tax=Chloropicon primus TaxID=1764295 RepID=A0A5B8N163_9CHLO|nr:lipase [Chloropicon primus]|eukprot:QDZ26026.1 lipase [Chloropicon primus]
MFRIPHGKDDVKVEEEEQGVDKKVVILQHGLLGSSFGWVVNLPHQSLAYLLADAGYDVWLPNSRGNTFSRNNTHYDPDSTEFWDYSWDDQAKYDLPAVYKYVLGVTGSEDLAYVGHSQGTTMMFAALSTPEIAAYITPRTSHYMALAPVAYTGNIEQPVIKDLADMSVAEILREFGVKEWIPDEWILHYIDPEICDIDPQFCNDLLNIIAGCTLMHKNSTAMANYMRINPAGTSVKNVVHWSQGIREGTFSMFDYLTPDANMKHYNQTTPPKYDLAKIALPAETLFFVGGYDTLANPTDVNHLIDLMQQATANDTSKMPYVYKKIDYDHLDFTIANDAYLYVYDKILSHLNRTHASSSSKKKK